MQDKEQVNTYSGTKKNLLHFLTVILKRKKMIAGITLSISAASVVWALNMKPVYMAETKVLLSQTSGSSLSQLTSQLNAISTPLGSALGTKNQIDLYLAMLKSRTIYDQIIDRFGLMEFYGTKYREDARQKLNNQMNARSTKGGIIILSIEDNDPKRSSDLANAFVEELKKFTQTLAVTEASERKLFFEEQLGLAKENLVKAEEAMQVYQERTGAIKIEKQAEAVIESIARLKAELAAKEVSLKVMRGYAKSKNPDLQRAEDELIGLEEQLRKLEARNAKPDPLMSSGGMPKIGMEYLRKLRELKYQETLYDLMSKQLEMARFDEVKDAVIIQVLDKAVQPEKRIKPRRTFIVIMATISVFFFSIMTALFMEHFGFNPDLSLKKIWFLPK